MNFLNHTVLISVYDKTGIAQFSTFLLKRKCIILSSGGTYDYIVSVPENKIFLANIHKIEDYISFPHILGGRVKTLHPKIYGGILNREIPKDYDEMFKHDIWPIDIIIVNLYPFKKVISKNHSVDDAIENIDIGGVSLIRAAFKNYKSKLILTKPSQYLFTQINWDQIDTNFRFVFAKQAMNYVSQYDIEITQYFDKSMIYKSYQKICPLKYGCNPHQNESYIHKLNDIRFPFEILNGKPGYINFIDAIQSWSLVTELNSILNVPCAASFKHTSPAGVGTSEPISKIYDNIYNINTEELSNTSIAFIRARTADPLSSFGDFIAISEVVDEETAKLIKREVSDGIIALNYTDKALEILKTKKSGSYIIIKGDKNILDNIKDKTEYRELNGIGLSQKINSEKTNDNYFMNIPTKNKELTEFAKKDLIIANTTLKYTPSNSIVYAKDGQVIGVGAGQQNRVDCVKLAGSKAKKWLLTTHPKTIQMLQALKSNTKRQAKVNIITQFVENDFTNIEYANWISNFDDGYWKSKFPESRYINKKEASEFINNMNVSMASDAFFPFRDNIDKCSQYGVKYILQPGGSIRDNNIIEACNDYNIVMCMSGIRVFTH